MNGKDIIVSEVAVGVVVVGEEEEEEEESFRERPGLAIAIKFHTLISAGVQCQRKRNRSIRVVGKGEGHLVILTTHQQKPKCLSPELPPRSLCACGIRRPSLLLQP